MVTKLEHNCNTNPDSDLVLRTGPCPDRALTVDRVRGVENFDSKYLVESSILRSENQNVQIQLSC